MISLVSLEETGYLKSSLFLSFCSKCPHRKHVFSIYLRHAVSLEAKTFAQRETCCLDCLWSGGKSVYFWCLVSESPHSPMSAFPMIVSPVCLTHVYFLIGSELGWGEWVLLIKAMQIQAYTSLYFTSQMLCFIFYKLKTRPSTSKKMATHFSARVALLRGVKPTITAVHACALILPTSVSSFNPHYHIRWAFLSPSVL